MFKPRVEKRIGSINRYLCIVKGQEKLSLHECFNKRKIIVHLLLFSMIAFCYIYKISQLFYYVVPLYHPKAN